MKESRDEPIIPADGRLITIDILRGLAILWVIVVHIYQPVTFEFAPRRDYYERFVDRIRESEPLAAFTAFWEIVFRIGDHGVTMFMILSGLSLTVTALRRGGSVRAWDFYSSRLRKVLLPYWVGWLLFMLALALLAAYRMWADGGSFAHNLQFMGTGRQMSPEIAIEGLLIAPRSLSLENAIEAQPRALWFVVLLVQYYLLFPLLLPLLKRLKPVAFSALFLAISIGSSAWMIWAFGDIDAAHGYIWAAWLPFRSFEFALGMALGYALVHEPGRLRRSLSRPPVVMSVVVAGLATHTVGSCLDSGNGYWNATAYSLIVTGLSAIMLTVICARPGVTLTSPPARLTAWVGTISYAVLITNEVPRLLGSYFLTQGWRYSAGWWYFMVVLYVPLTVVFAYPLAAVLGLLPKPPRAASPAAVPAPPALSEG
ncbi:MAG: acyltransferase [Chloroflexi bacterium]|nr:acyltransferase [Chloroflexota bacterium]